MGTVVDAPAVVAEEVLCITYLFEAPDPYLFNDSLCCFLHYVC
jgi:hypothetical protein